jgi:1-aminocyclopropane-1-carboxylate deaminase/D-cysteine desulfhydrase-like pyridoxal-dependent ACC family enzyme
MEAVRLVGVSPDDSSASIAAHVAEIAADTAKLLNIAWTPRPLSVEDGFIGEGYGVPTAEGTAAFELVARLEGIVLDPVYTAKSMAALMAHIREGRFQPSNRVVFWHTGGQVALFTTP